jgi:hypothetical protein
MSSQGEGKKPESKILRYDNKIQRLEFRRDVPEGLSIAQMHALDELGKLSRPARPDPPDPAEMLVAPDEDIAEPEAPKYEEVHDGYSAVMPHNPPPPRPLKPSRLKYQQIQRRLDAANARRSLSEMGRSLKDVRTPVTECMRLRIRSGMS